MEKIDIAIIGAGVVGLSICAELGEGAALLERNYRHGMETSSRNSEVIHAGLYYPPDSLKAKFCVEGARLLYNICAAREIWHSKIGKIIIGEEEGLGVILERGEKSGAQGLRIIDRAEIKRLEPDAEGNIALYSPETGMLDSEGLMRYLYSTAKEKGAEVVYNSDVEGIEPFQGGFKLVIKSGVETHEIHAKKVINSAGNNSGKIAAMICDPAERERLRIRYLKGSFFAVTNRKRFLAKGLIYNEPKSETTLGIHVIPCIPGRHDRMRFGPYTQYVDEVEYNVDESNKAVFLEHARKFFPEIEAADLQPDTAGVASKLMGAGDPWRDFIIERDRNYSGFINLVGIDSPGLTSALAIAKYVRKLVTEE